MNLMKHLLTPLLLALTLTAAAQTALTPEVLGELRASNTDDALRRNILQAGALKKLAVRADHDATVDPHFSIDIRNQGITDQQSSGRCWLFTGTNVLRHQAARRTGVRGLTFSQTFLFFYDQLEKSNLFLQAIIDTRDEELDSPKVQWLMSNPLSDGGTYTGVADLVTKYGLVPSEAMRETYVANNTTEFCTLLKRKLREEAIHLREQAALGVSEKRLAQQKVEAMKTVYHLLTLAYGTPPAQFVWAPKKDGQALREPKTYTPLEFYREAIGTADDLNADYVMLMNDPSRPYNKTYEIDLDRHLYDGHNWLYLNLDMKTLKPMLIASLRDSVQMYFSCDVGKELNRATGLLDPDNFDYATLLGTTFSMTKQQRIQTHDSGSTHAMTLMGVDLDAAGAPTRWKVENSWGADAGAAGYLVMTDRWFDEYMFRVVVARRYCTPEVLELLKQKPTRLPAWDPMFQSED